MGFPAKLTAEEQALVTKYALLKKKKKVVHTQKTNTSTFSTETKEVTAVVPRKEPSKDVAAKESTVKPKDAKEIAKQLIASGQVKINKDTGNRSFKRARPSAEKKVREPTITEAAFASKAQTKKIENIRRDSYNNFVSSGGEKSEQDGDNDQGNQGNQRNQEKPFDKRPGQRNLFISGYGLTKNILESSFHDFGPIKNSYFDQDKSVGYITYHRQDSAQKAIDELHGSQVKGVILKVVYARKRPYNPDDNRFTSRPTGVKPDDPTRSDRRSTDNRTHSADPARLSDESPTKRNEANKKRKLVTYSEPDEFDF